MYILRGVHAHILTVVSILQPWAGLTGYHFLAPMCQRVWLGTEILCILKILNGTHICHRDIDSLNYSPLLLPLFTLSPFLATLDPHFLIIYPCVPLPSSVIMRAVHLTRTMHGPLYKSPHVVRHYAATLFTDGFLPSLLRY